jgi:hypothetical protein
MLHFSILRQFQRFKLRADFEMGVKEIIYHTTICGSKAIPVKGREGL